MDSRFLGNDDQISIETTSPSLARTLKTVLSSKIKYCPFIPFKSPLYDWDFNKFKLFTFSGYLFTGKLIWISSLFYFK